MGAYLPTLLHEPVLPYLSNDRTPLTQQECAVGFYLYGSWSFLGCFPRLFCVCPRGELYSVRVECRSKSSSISGLLGVKIRERGSKSSVTPEADENRQ